MNIPKKNLLLFCPIGLALIAISTWFIQQKSQRSLLHPSRFVQVQHDIDTLAFAKKEGILITASTGERGQVTIWNTNGQQKQFWKVGGNSVYLSPNGRNLLAITYKRFNTQCVWYDALTGHVLRQWTAPGRFRDVARDLSVLVSASTSDQGKKRVTILHNIDVATGQERSRIVLPSTEIWNIRFSRDARYLRVSGYKEASQLIRLSDKQSVLPLPPLQSVNISRDERTVTGLAEDGTLHFWQLPSRAHTMVSTGLHRAQWFYRLDDDRIVVSGEVEEGKDHKSIIQVRSPDGATTIRTLDGYPEVVSPTGQYVAFKRYEASKKLSWPRTYYDIQNIATGQGSISLDVSSDPLGYNRAQNGFSSDHLSFSYDERHIAFASNDGLLRLYDLKTRSSSTHGIVATSSGRSILQFQTGISDALVFPDGTVAASGRDDEYRSQSFVRLARPSGGVSSYAAALGSGNVSHLGLSPDGRTLAASSQWGAWLLLNVKSGQSRETAISTGVSGAPYYSYYPPGQPLWLEGANNPFTVLSATSFGADPLTLTSWDGAGKVRQTRRVSPSQQREGGRNFLLSGREPSPDGRKLVLLWNGVQQQKKNNKLSSVVMGGGLIEVRETATNRVLSRLELPRKGGFGGSLGRPVWSKDGSHIAIADEVGRVAIWDAVSGRRHGQLSGARTEINGTSSAFADSTFNQWVDMAFTPDRRFLAVGRDDGSIYLYSLTTLLPVAQIGKAATQLGWMQFSPDGRILYGIVANGKEVLSWEMPRLNS